MSYVGVLVLSGIVKITPYTIQNGKVVVNSAYDYTIKNNVVTIISKE